MHTYRVAIRNKGSREVQGESPSDAFKKISPDWELSVTSDAFNADVCIELLNGSRKSKSYYKLMGKPKGVNQQKNKMAQPTQQPSKSSTPTGRTKEERFTKALAATIPAGAVMSVLYPNGYSSAQKDKLRSRIFDVFGNPYTSGKKWPAEIRRLEAEMGAMDMLAALVAQCGARAAIVKYKAPKTSRWDVDKRSYYEKYLDDYLREGGTKEEFDKFLAIQEEHYKRSEVAHNIHTDFEGVSYNGIKEKNEPFNSMEVAMLFSIWETVV